MDNEIRKNDTENLVASLAEDDLGLVSGGARKKTAAKKSTKKTAKKKDPMDEFFENPNLDKPQRAW